MNLNHGHWRLTVVRDPADAFHVAVGQGLAQYAPVGCHVDFVTGGEVHPAPADVVTSDVVLVLDPAWLPALAAGQPESGHRARLTVFLDGRDPRNDHRFESAYRLADGVFFEDLTRWRQLGRPAGTMAMPHSVDETLLDSSAGIEERGNRTVWLVPSEADFPFRYEPWLPGPHHTVEGTEFQDEVVSYPVGGRLVERAAAFRKAAVVICAAETVAARRHTLEAAACGCAVVATREVNEAGLIRNGVTGIEVESEGRAMLGAIREARQRRLELSAQALADLSARAWPAQALGVFALLRGSEVLSLDLSEQVTVFVTTVGASSFNACMSHLKRQDCRFRVQVINQVAPMSAAFQQMLDNCTTPYYVQVDEDMMLYRDAVRRLHAFIVSAPNDIAVAVANLHDTFLGQEIQGVKIFRHDIVRRYPLADVRSCEMDQLERMRRDGWRAVALPPVCGDTQPPILGLHDMPRDPRTIYERFRTLALARRQHRRRLRYLERWPAMFVERYLRHGDPLDGYALLGMLSVCGDENSGRGHEKNFRAYDDLPGLTEALAFIGRADLSAVG